jgi:hypothetical protein
MHIMKRCKALVAFILLACVCFGLCACGFSEENIVGSWKCSYVYGTKKDKFDVTFTLSDDGNYTKTIIKNGEESDTEQGTYEIVNSKVLLYKDGDRFGTVTTYEYLYGRLENNGHIFKKSRLNQ